MKPLTVQKLLRAHPKAAGIYLILWEKAQGQPLNTTRPEIAALADIPRLATLSKALAVLHDHGWIRRTVRVRRSADLSSIISRWVEIEFLRPIGVKVNSVETLPADEVINSITAIPVVPTGINSPTPAEADADLEIDCGEEPF